MDPDLKYRRIDFANSEFPGCCGIFIAYGFSEPEVVSDWGYYPPKKKSIQPQFKTREEQALACIREIEQKAEDNNQYCIQLALICEGQIGTGAAQFPELQEQLVKSGYNIDREWLAPRHGNRLRLFSKVLHDAENKSVSEWEDPDDFDDFDEEDYD